MGQDKTGQTVTISIEEYQELLEDSKMLLHLEGAGVDNWEGYGDAMESLAADSD